MPLRAFRVFARLLAPLDRCGVCRAPDDQCWFELQSSASTARGCPRKEQPLSHTRAAAILCPLLLLGCATGLHTRTRTLAIARLAVAFRSITPATYRESSRPAAAARTDFIILKTTVSNPESERRSVVVACQRLDQTDGRVFARSVVVKPHSDLEFSISGPTVDVLSYKMRCRLEAAASSGKRELGPWLQVEVPADDAFRPPAV
jgi:hypothetical protein